MMMLYYRFFVLYFYDLHGKYGLYETKKSICRQNTIDDLLSLAVFNSSDGCHTVEYGVCRQ